MTDLSCTRCEKPPPLCVCAALTPIDNDIFVLILRHPQEQDTDLGTARLTTCQLKNSLMKTGLSWPNLSRVLGREADPKRWGVLYLGTAKTSVSGYSSPSPLVALTKKGDPAPDQENILKQIEGIILLDGNWSQAKALWWRNPWLLKCRRLLLQPPGRSLYGSLRKEPRRESVSTIEAAAYALAALENDLGLSEKILPPFHLLLQKARAKKK